jgi:hypothetical protein
VPTLIVDADLMTAVGQIAGLHGAVTEVDVPPKALHLREQIFVLPPIDLNVLKIAGYACDSGWR